MSLLIIGDKGDERTPYNIVLGFTYSMPKNYHECVNMDCQDCSFKFNVPLDNGVIEWQSCEHRDMLMKEYYSDGGKGR